MCSALYSCCSVSDLKHKLFTSKQTREKEAGINKLATFAAVVVGLGREGICHKMSTLNIPAHVSAFNCASHLSKILCTTESVYNDQLSNAVQSVRAKIIEESGGEQGIRVVISVDTGEVLDMEILSKVCEICKHQLLLICIAKGTQIFKLGSKTTSDYSADRRTSMKVNNE